MRRRTPPQAARTAGFSLVEVLVSIVILSFGLLGMVGLQAGALRNNRDARLQSVAVNLAREMAEMMRGNKAVAVLPAAPANPYLGVFSGSALVPATQSYCLAASTACATPGDVASAEMTEWLARVSAELPGARVTICSDSAPYTAAGLPQWPCTGGTDMIVIKIGWTRLTTDTSRAAAARVDAAGAPSVVVPVSPGNAT